MILRYSQPKNVPYIEFDDGNMLIFSTLTEHPEKGFNWMAFSGKIVSEHKLGKGKRKKIISSAESTNFITSTKFEEIPKKVKETTLTPIVLKFLKRTFYELSDGDGYFPRKNLKKLYDMIDDKFNHIDRDVINDDPDLDEEDIVEWK